MLNIVDIGQSVTREAINQSSLGDILTAAAPAAKPAHAGKEAPLDAAGRGFSTADEYAVIDVDAHKGGGATLQRLILIEGFPKTAATQPKRGRGRLFCALPPGVVVQSGGIALGPGLTLQSSRGSSICARSYVWATDDPVAAAPQWLLARIDAASQSPQHMTDATAPTAHAAATAPCINSHQTGDNMPAHDASNSEARGDTTHDKTTEAHDAESGEAQAETTDKTDNVVQFPLPPAVAETELARVFMQALGTEKRIKGADSENARHDLFAINPTRPEEVEAATYMPTEHGEADKWIEEQGKKKWNVYISINEGRERESLEHRLSKENIGAVRAIAVDLDPGKLPKGADDPSGNHFRSERARLLQVVETICKDEKFSPSLVVDSGGGYWLLWLLEKKAAVTPEVFALAEGISRTLQTRFGGDSAFDICRVMRLPGTVNYPNASKAKQGRTPTLAFIPPKFINKQRYTLDQLAEWAPPTPAKADSKDQPKEPIDWDEVQTDTYEDLPAELREKFEALRTRHSFIDTLWGGVPTSSQTDISASGFEYALARALKRQGTFTSTEFAQVRQVWDHKSVKHANDLAADRRSVQRAWGNAPTSTAGANGLEAVEGGESKAPPKPPKPSQPPEPVKPIEPLGGLATPLRRFDPATLSPVPWIVRGLTARRAISTLTGPGGVSKSTWTLMLAVAAATGRSDICGYAMLKRERAWVWSQEDDIDQMELRVAAIMQAFGVSHDDLLDESGRSMLYLDSGLGKGKRLNLAKRAGENIVDGEHMADMLASAKAIGASLVILDPLISLHQASENDNVQMRAVFDVISQIAVEANCAVLIVSHTGKPDKGSSKGFAGDSYASRGASAQPDAARVAVTFMGMSESDTKLWNVPAGLSHADFVRIDDSKSNLGRKRREPRWFRREAVTLQGFAGDDMEVLRPVEMVAKVKEGRPDLLHAIARAIANNLPAGEPHGVAAIAPHLPSGEATALQDRNRARTINEAFGGEGSNEYLTDFGTLRRSKGVGNRGTLFALTPATHAPQIVSE